MDFISVKAPAKVNLYLHVTGRRPDGYHLLDSLFVFAEDGDVISVRKAEKLSLRIVGPYAGGLSDGEDNIVLKAARALAEACGTVPAAEIVLEKNLPVASGIGGGSSDAAATLKALMRLWKKDVPAEKLEEIALRLGADVPSCLAAEAVQVSGIGDILVPAPVLPKLFMLLVNPNKPVSTPAVFKARDPVFSKPSPFVEKITDFDAFVEELKKRHNDLCEAACRIEPDVRQVLTVLEKNPFCRFSGMSGSGGTCFALFASDAEASSAYENLRVEYPNWWFFNTTVE